MNEGQLFDQFPLDKNFFNKIHCLMVKQMLIRRAIPDDKGGFSPFVQTARVDAKLVRGIDGDRI